MTEVTLRDFRERVTEHLSRVTRNHEEIVITEGDGEPIVVLPLAELRSLQETLHLLSTPANADRLLRSIAELDAGEGVEHRLPNA